MAGFLGTVPAPNRQANGNFALLTGNSAAPSAEKATGKVVY
jgi:hypothetical protein